MYYEEINACSIDRCLPWKIPSNDRCIKEVRFSSISHLRIEKSNLTDVVLANTVARPPTNVSCQLPRVFNFFPILWTISNLFYGNPGTIVEIHNFRRPAEFPLINEIFGV